MLESGERSEACSDDLCLILLNAWLTMFERRMGGWNQSAQFVRVDVQLDDVRCDAQQANDVS